MNDNSFWVGVFIIIGVMSQTALAVRPRNASDFFLLGMLILAAAALGFMPWDNPRYFAGARVLVTSVLLLVGVSLAFRDRLMPPLPEGALLIWNVIFLYAVLSRFDFNNTFATYTTIASGVVMLMVLLPLRFPFVIKAALYGWFLFMVVTITFLQFRFNHFGAFIGEEIEDLSYIRAGLDGMAFAYLAMHASFLFAPLLSDAKDSQRQHAAAMAERLSDDQVHPLVGMIVLAASAALIYSNLTYEWISAGFLISLMLVVTSLVGTLRLFLHRPIAD